MHYCLTKFLHDEHMLDVGSHKFIYLMVQTPIIHVLRKNSNNNMTQTNSPTKETPYYHANFQLTSFPRKAVTHRSSLPPSPAHLFIGARRARGAPIHRFISFSANSSSLWLLPRKVDSGTSEQCLRGKADNYCGAIFPAVLREFAYDTRPIFSRPCLVYNSIRFEGKICSNTSN